MSAFDTVAVNLAEQFDLTPCEGGFLTPRGLFIAQRPRAGWVWDVWTSVEGFKSQSFNASVRLNCRSLAEAVRVARDESEL